MILFIKSLFMLAQLAPSLASERPSGHDKRRVKNQWPKPFWLYSKSNRRISGAAVFCSASAVQVRGVPEVNVTIGRVVPLREYVEIPASHCRYFGAVFHLRPLFELELRQNTARAGGSMVVHFADFATLGSCRAFTVPDSIDLSAAFLDAGIQVEFSVPRSHVQTCGVEIVDVTGEVVCPAIAADEDGAGSDEEAADVVAKVEPLQQLAVAHTTRLH